MISLPSRCASPFAAACVGPAFARAILVLTAPVLGVFAGLRCVAVLTGYLRLFQRLATAGVLLRLKSRTGLNRSKTNVILIGFCWLVFVEKAEQTNRCEIDCDPEISLAPAARFIACATACCWRFGRLVADWCECGKPAAGV
ncbi:hypothetical protein KCP73_16895 [Salmonella enterica subsp. enterica]|nr:hypothetical protein KCP73_16895 [Salmonella enterica subsp. enterica]